MEVIVVDGMWRVKTEGKAMLPGIFTNRTMAEKALRAYKIKAEVAAEKREARKQKKAED